MKSKLDTKWSQWINNPIKNPTQTFINRFKRAPHGEMQSLFKKSEENFNSILKDSLRTRYSDMITEDSNAY